MFSLCSDDEQIGFCQTKGDREFQMKVPPHVVWRDNPQRLRCVECEEEQPEDRTAGLLQTPGWPAFVRRSCLSRERPRNSK